MFNVGFGRNVVLAWFICDVTLAGFRRFCLVDYVYWVGRVGFCKVSFEVEYEYGSLGLEGFVW